MGADEKSYMRKGFLIHEEMLKYFVIYEEARPGVVIYDFGTAPFWIGWSTQLRPLVITRN